MTLAKQDNKRVIYKGLEFDSLMECRYYKHLEQQDDVIHIERAEQVEILPGYTINSKKRQAVKYTPDFIVTYKDGTKRVIELKAKPILIPRDFPIRQKLYEMKFGIELEVVLPFQTRWLELKEWNKAKRALKK